MVEVSKHLFDIACRDVECSAILHPWNKNCLAAAPALYVASTIGSAKFYSIIYAAQIIMRGKKMMKKDEWIKMGNFYLRSTLLGVLVTATAPNISCTIRKLLGNKFTYYTYLFIPFSLTGLFIYLEPPSRRGLIINLFCNLVIEYWLRTLQNGGYISITKTKETLLFMLGSALLFYLMRLEGDKKEKTHLFWLYTPEKVKRKSEDGNVCPHQGSCQKYITKGYATYFGVGLALSLSKVILPKISTPIKAISSIRGKHFKLALFFGSYIGIYRAVVCYLCRRRGYDSALYALPAGYLAGISFVFSPNLGWAIASMTAAFKLYSTILYEKNLLPANMPIPEIMYCLCQGILFSSRVLHPKACPGYVVNLMKSVSNGRSEVIYQSFLDTIKRAL